MGDMEPQGAADRNPPTTKEAKFTLIRPPMPGSAESSTSSLPQALSTSHSSPQTSLLPAGALGAFSDQAVPLTMKDIEEYIITTVQSGLTSGGITIPQHYPPEVKEEMARQQMEMVRYREQAAAEKAEMEVKIASLEEAMSEIQTGYQQLQRDTNARVQENTATLTQVNTLLSSFQRPSPVRQPGFPLLPLPPLPPLPSHRAVDPAQRTAPSEFYRPSPLPESDAIKRLPSGSTVSPQGFMLQPTSPGSEERFLQSMASAPSPSLSLAGANLDQPAAVADAGGSSTNPPTAQRTCEEADMTAASPSQQQQQHLVDTSTTVLQTPGLLTENSPEDQVVSPLRSTSDHARSLTPGPTVETLQPSSSRASSMSPDSSQHSSHLEEEHDIVQNKEKDQGNDELDNEDGMVSFHIVLSILMDHTDRRL